MITTIATFLISKGVGEQFAKPLAFVGIALVALPILLGLKSCYDSSVVESAVNGANVEALETAREADESAAIQAEADGKVLDENLQETLDAIKNANDTGAPSTAAVAHNCKRLRRYGLAGADLPVACRGGEATD